MKNIFYEDDEVRIQSTGRNYDFICTVENKTDRAIVIVFEGEYEYLENITVEPEDWVGILADENGRETVKAFEKECFYTIFEEDYEGE